MSFSVVIPARRASTRLPDKVLRHIAGQPMLAHVCARAAESDAKRVVVATDDEAVAAVAADAGVEVAMTRADHACGSDRIAQAVSDWPDDAIVVNVQADEPLMPPALIDQVATLLARAPRAAIATACTPIRTAEALHDSNNVKVVCDARGRALYFSRAPIPYHRDSGNTALPEGVCQHLGIYAYRAGALKRFAAAPPGRLEQIESLEQLRAYELDMVIQVARATEVPGPGVDTAADLAQVERLLLDRGG